MKPKYFVVYADADSTVDMLYATYPDKSYFQTVSGWYETALTTSYFEQHPHAHPCSLADVRAMFNNISAHKRPSDNTLVGTKPAY